MKNNIVILSTTALSQSGSISKTNLLNAIIQEFKEIKSVTQDYYAEFQEKLKNIKDQNSYLTETGYQARIAELNREEQRSGEKPIVKCEGLDSEGILIQVIIGERITTARVLDKLNPESKFKASFSIPKVKMLIMKHSLDAVFDDFPK